MRSALRNQRGADAVGPVGSASRRRRWREPARDWRPASGASNVTVNVLAARPTGPLRVLRLRDSVALDTEPGGVPSPTLPPSSWAASRRVGRSCAMGGMGAMALSGMAFDRRCLPACHDGHCVVFRTPGAVLRRLTVSVRGLPHGRVAARSAATAGTAPDARSAPGALLSVDAAHAARHQLVSFHTSDDPGCRESSLHGRRVGRRVRHEQDPERPTRHIPPGPPQSGRRPGSLAHYLLRGWLRLWPGACSCPRRHGSSLYERDVSALGVCDFSRRSRQ